MLPQIPSDQKSLPVEADGEPSPPAWLPWLRRIGVFIVGMTVLLIGVCLIVLPGPAVIVIPLGLAILATEFWWAARLLRWMQRRLQAINARVTGGQGKG